MAIERPDHHTVLMDYARNAARRSTCSRLHVGAVLTADTRLISTGYNGAPSGMPHCDHTCDCWGCTGKHNYPKECKAFKPCEISVHAEANAIAFAARYGVRTAGTEMYVTHQPCLSCAKLIINAGVKAVYYAERYRDLNGVHLLNQAGVKVTYLQ